MQNVQGLFALERQFGGVLEIDTATVSSLTSFSPGYIDKENEIIVGLQTNRPLKRGVCPFGGIRMARQACEAYGYKLSEVSRKISCIASMALQSRSRMSPSFRMKPLRRLMAA